MNLHLKEKLTKLAFAAVLLNPNGTFEILLLARLLSRMGEKKDDTVIFYSHFFWNFMAEVFLKFLFIYHVKQINMFNPCTKALFIFTPLTAFVDFKLNVLMRFRVHSANRN